MSKLSFFDKLKILFDVASSSYIFLIVLLIVVSLAFIFITTNRSNAKSSKIAYTIMYLAVILVGIGVYYDSLSKMFDYMMNNLFIAIYFPNLAIYFAAIIASNIILWISMFNFKLHRTIKRINVVMYSIIHYILILIINVITKNKLDVFTQKSVYDNKQALGLLELSSTIFVVWIIFLIVYKLIRNYQKKKYPEVKRVERREEALLPQNAVVVKHPKEVLAESKVVEGIKTNIPENINLVNNPDTIKVEKVEVLEMENKSILPSNINIINHPEIIKLDEKETKENVLPENINIVKHPIEVKTKEVIETVTNKAPTMDNLFTLEDYKLVLQLLKDYKQKEKQETEEKLKKIEDDQRKYSQIEEFYRNANR